MSYPFGSGMPQPNYSQQQQHQQPGGYPQVPFGAGLPTGSHSFNPGYPTQTPYPTGQPSYPGHSAPYPTQYPGSQSYGPGFQASPYPPGQPAYPQSAYPPAPQSGYPTGPQSTYPPPAHQSAYPPGPQPAYPTAHPPSQSPYPTNQWQSPTATTQPDPDRPQSSAHYPTVPKNPSGYPPQIGGYGSGQSTAGGGGYAGATTMANCFTEMQSHIKDIRKENRSKGNPTVVPVQNFDPVADAKVLRKAMKGFGTDENALIEIICRRSNEQRQIIQRDYKTNFGKDLIEDIKSETTGNFENLLVALLTPTVNYYIKELHDAMSGIGTDEDVLIEVLCSMSNYEIHTIKNAYERFYGKNLESELMSETSGNFKRLLVSLCAGGRDESGVTNAEAAHRDATELLKAGELRVGTDESTFNMILCQRNYAQIKLVCEQYQAMTGHSLEKAIKKEFSGDIMEGLIAIVQCTSNKSEFFASRLHKSMAGIGTNDTQLIRIIVTRCEIDLNDIKVAFERLYGKSLKSWIKGDTSGHYKHALYALIGEQRSS